MARAAASSSRVASGMALPTALQTTNTKTCLTRQPPRKTTYSPQRRLDPGASRGCPRFVASAARRLASPMRQQSAAQLKVCLHPRRLMPCSCAGRDCRQLQEQRGSCSSRRQQQTVLQRAPAPTAGFSIHGRPIYSTQHRTARPDQQRVARLASRWRQHLVAPPSDETSGRRSVGGSPSYSYPRCSCQRQRARPQLEEPVIRQPDSHAATRSRDTTCSALAARVLRPLRHFAQSASAVPRWCVRRSRALRFLAYLLRLPPHKSMCRPLYSMSIVYFKLDANREAHAERLSK